MEETELQRRLRQHLGLRVGPEMAKYLLKKLEGAPLGQGSISAMGGKPRTSKSSPPTATSLISNPSTSSSAT